MSRLPRKEKNAPKVAVENVLSDTILKRLIKIAVLIDPHRLAPAGQHNTQEGEEGRGKKRKKGPHSGEVALLDDWPFFVIRISGATRGSMLSSLAQRRGKGRGERRGERICSPRRASLLRRSYPPAHRRHTMPCEEEAMSREGKGGKEEEKALSSRSGLPS